MIKLISYDKRVQRIHERQWEISQDIVNNDVISDTEKWDKNKNKVRPVEYNNW